MARLLVLANEATAAQRRVYFHLVDATDGLTAETGEAAGQPQVSSDGGAWTNTGIGTLNAIGNGRYYADLTQTLVATAGTLIETRYKSANTAECPGDSVQVVAFDPNDAVRLGLTALPNAAAEAAGGLYTRGTGAGQLSQTANGELGVVSLANTLTTYTGNTPQTGDAYAIVNSVIHGNAALKTLIDAVDNFIDTEIADIQARLPAALTADGLMKSDALRFGGTLYATALAAEVDAIWDEVLTAATHNVATSAGKRLRQLAGITTISGTVNDAAATTTSFITDLPSTSDLAYHHLMITFTSGALVDLGAWPIESYAGSTTKRLTIDGTLPVAPANTDGFDIINLHVHPKSSIASSVRTELATELGRIDVASSTLATPTNITAATGVVLDATGLDAIPVTAPAGVAATFREMIVQTWRRFFKRVTKDATNIKTYADNGTSVVTTQAYTSAGGTDDIGAGI